MPSIAYDKFVRWSNYHLTTGTRNAPDLEPSVAVEDLGRIYVGDLGDGARIGRFAATYAALSGHLGRVAYIMGLKAKMKQLGDPPRPFPATMVGRGWSFSNIIGADQGKDRESQLMCDGLSGAVMLESEELAAAAQVDQGSIALVGGGMRLRELANWAATYQRSLHTSGTHLGATIAGGAATSSHGSRLGFGGIQNMIHGIHFVTGIGDSVWIERGSRPILSDAARNALNPGGGSAVRFIADDNQFEDALVHLGAMGIVNCVAVALIPDTGYDQFRKIRAVGSAWLDLVAAGDWSAIAADCGVARSPVFYEATLDPHDWAGTTALHTFYFDDDGQGVADTAPVETVTVGDAVARFGEQFSVPLSAEQGRESLIALPDIDKLLDGETDEIDWQALPARMGVFVPGSSAQSVFQYYQTDAGFEPAGNWQYKRSWRQLHGDEITSGQPGSLYNASYAMNRADVPRAIPAICAAVANLPMSFVFTLRFVTNAAGTMAFTRFPECAVIEIDGLSPWICRRVLRDLSRTSPSYYRDRKMLKYLEFALPQGARNVAQALVDAGIDYSSHWAKRGYLSHDKIQHDFGPLNDPESRLARWRATRTALIANPLGQAVFWNWGIVNQGLLDRPSTLPPL